MSRRFSVEVFKTGVIITPIGLGEGEPEVMELHRKEDILLNLYQRIFDWKVGDKINIVRKD